MTARDAGRVIAGLARGIRLDAPGQDTRPMADRVKQTLFAILEPDLPGARVLDLFAGSGAAGLEALSRGAAHATFVERSSGAAAVIATNLARTHLGGPRARIVRAEALTWLAGPDSASAAPFDIVILDPPYADTANRTADLYAVDCDQVAHDVRAWAIENGSNPSLRICLAGYDGEHQMPAGWECVAWKAQGGYGSQNGEAANGGRLNANKERLWFSPSCIEPERELSLFDFMAAAPAGRVMAGADV